MGGRGGGGGGRGGGRGGRRGGKGGGSTFQHVVPKFLEQYRHLIEGEKKPDVSSLLASGWR